MTAVRWGALGGLAARPLGAGRRLLARTPLRVELVVALLALVAVALTLISLGSVAVLRGSLVGRLDDQLKDEAGRAVHSAYEHGELGPQQAPGDDRAESEFRPPSRFLEQELDAAGRTVYPWYPDTLQNGQSVPRLPAVATLRAGAGTPFTAPATGGRGRWRVLVQPTIRGSDLVVVASSLDEVDATIGRLIPIDLAVSAAVLLLLAGVGVAIVRASLRPLVQIEQTAAAIAAGHLSSRVPERDPRTEVGRLGRALNSMLAQIETAFRARAASEAAARRSEDRMRRFVTDASHELRTPLTTIRGFAELYRQGAAREPAELDGLMRRIEDQAARMGLLVEDLLLLARLDHQRPLDRRPVDLLAVAADSVQDARAVAPDRRIGLQAGGDDGGVPLVVLGDEPRLRQVIANLMSNALTHTPAGSPVEVRARSDQAGGGRRAVVEVADHGPGLTQEQAERVFERFYRADQARSHQHGGGTGLGLAIVAALVAAHDGTVEVDTSPGGGATFRVLLPLAPDAGDPPTAA